MSYSGEQLTKRNRDTPAFPPRNFFLYLLFATFNLRTQFVQNLLCSLAYQSSPSLLVNRAGAAIIDKEGSEGGGAVVKHVLRRSAVGPSVWKAVEIAVCSTARIIKSLSLPHSPTRRNLMLGSLAILLSCGWQSSDIFFQFSRSHPLFDTISSQFYHVILQLERRFVHLKFCSSAISHLGKSFCPDGRLRKTSCSRC